MLVVIAAGIAFGERLDPEPVVRRVRHDVNDTRYRLVAVQGRVSVRHDIHSLNGDGGDHGENVLVHETLAVEQGQCRAGAEAAQVDSGERGLP